jgi:hypothetical protein
MASDGVRWRQMASDGVRWRQMASDGVRWRQMASDGVRWRQMASDGVRWRQMASDGVRWRQMASDGVRWRQMASDGVRWRQMASDGVRWRQMASDGVRWRQMASDGVRWRLTSDKKKIINFSDCEERVIYSSIHPQKNLGFGIHQNPYPKKPKKWVWEKTQHFWSYSSQKIWVFAKVRLLSKLRDINRFYKICFRLSDTKFEIILTYTGK